jgi:hypothetical protein
MAHCVVDAVFFTFVKCSWVYFSHRRGFSSSIGGSSSSWVEWVTVNCVHVVEVFFVVFDVSLTRVGVTLWSNGAVSRWYRFLFFFVLIN